jgi:hypothetical protein
VLDRNKLLPNVRNDSLRSCSASIDPGREADLGRAIKRPFNDAERLVGEAGGFTAFFKERTDREENEEFSVTETFTAVLDFETAAIEVAIP